MANQYYAADQNQVGWMYDSGTYAVASTGLLWPGMVQSHTIAEDEGITPVRFVGQTSRNIDTHIQTAINATGTLSYYPQDWRMLGIALGINADAGSPTPYTHSMTEANTTNSDKHQGEIMASFMIEDSQQSWTGSGLSLVRQVKGCMVNTLAINGAEGEPVTIDVDYIGQSIGFSSGAATAVSAQTGRPYMSEDFIFAIPSGTVYDKVKTWNITINENLEAPHYSTGSPYIGAPIPANRDYEVTLTMNADPAKSKTLYDTYYRSNTAFNMHVTTKTNPYYSGNVVMTFSGCRITNFDNPLPNEGINEWTVTIQPQACSAIVSDTVQFYNNGSFA